MKPDYEVIIVGAGPAGATLAYELARAGIRVLLLEKEKLPRYKCCAGGISAKTAGILDTSFYEVVEDSISSAIVTFKGEKPYRKQYGQTVLYTVMRDKFDYSLVKRAEKAGAIIMPGCKVLGVQFHDGGVEVSTPVGSFLSQIVAGADGAGSVVARSLGLGDYIDYVTAIQSEILVSEKEMASWRGQVRVDLGRITGGYGWVFPKSNNISIGMACLHAKPKSLKQRYQEFLNSLDIGQYTITKWSSGLIPMCKGKVVVYRARAVLLGDAAGLVDPLTGEGIYNAVLSAQLAAPAIEKSLVYNEIKLYDYQRAVEEQIIPEMRIARSFSRILAQFPYLVYKMLGRDDRLFRACSYLLRGEIDYATIMQKLGTIGRLYTLLSQ